MPLHFPSPRRDVAMNRGSAVDALAEHPWMKSRLAGTRVSPPLQYYSAICLAIILSVFVFSLLTMRAGQPWPDDFAMYVHEAQNIASHTPLGQTGYIYDPYNPSIGPRAYPPFFPFLLVPGYLWGGVENLTPMKVEVISCFIGLLLVLWLYTSSGMAPEYRAAMLLIVGFSPVFWRFKDLIVSDLPFALFFYGALATADNVANCSSRFSPKNLLKVAALGALVYMCYGTRTIGIVLIAALAFLAILRWKSAGPLLLTALGLGMIPILIQMRLSGGEASYADQLRLGLSAFVLVLLKNAYLYTWTLATFWDNAHSKIIRDVIFLVISSFALLAYFIHWRKRPRIYEIVLPLYLMLVILWPNPGGDRYLIPVFPLYVCYALEGIAIVGTWARSFQPRLVATCLTCLILVCYTAQFAASDFGPFREGVTAPEAAALFSFVRSSTNPNDIFIFRRPRAFALYTDRSAAVYPEPNHSADFSGYFHTIGATYIVEAPALDDMAFIEFVSRTYSADQPVF